MAEESRVLYCTYVLHWLASLYVRQNVQMLCFSTGSNPTFSRGGITQVFCTKDYFSFQLDGR